MSNAMQKYSVDLALLLLLLEATYPSFGDYNLREIHGPLFHSLGYVVHVVKMELWHEWLLTWLRRRII